MKAFTDNTGFTWQIQLDRGEQNRVYADTGFDVTRIAEPGQMERLKEDAQLTTDVLFAVCRQQADSIKIDRDEFVSRLTGRPTADATILLLDALVQFYPADMQPAIAAGLWSTYGETLEEVGAA